jgi:hypothetical protein
MSRRQPTDPTQPTIMRMREGKEGGGKGPLLSEGLALTLATGATDVLFVPPQPMAFDRYNGEVSDVSPTLPSEFGGGFNHVMAIIPPPPSPVGSPASEDSTWASSEQGSASSPIPRSSPTPAPSSPATGPTSPTSGISRLWATQGERTIQMPHDRGTMHEHAVPTVVAMDPALLWIGPAPMSGQGGHRARGSASPDNAGDSVTTAAASPSPGLTLWGDTDPEPSSSRTFRASSAALMGWTGTPSYVHWENSGTGGPTGFATLNGSECRSVAGECSSSPSTLADILTPTAPDRFSLSARAAAGIMRRSAKRGRRLPAELEVALESLEHSLPASLRTSRKPTSDTSSWTVRRITPVEGERLMGWPDGHTIAPR